MNEEFKNAKKAVVDLEYKLSQVVDALNEMENNTSPSKLNDDELLEYDILRGLQNSLQDALWDIQYLQQPIAAEGHLYKNSSGRYAINDDHYFTSGSPIEIYVYDEWEDRRIWKKTRIEHNNRDYCAVGYDESLDGVRARIRGII